MTKKDKQIRDQLLEQIQHERHLNGWYQHEMEKLLKRVEELGNAKAEAYRDVIRMVMGSE